MHPKKLKYAVLKGFKGYVCNATRGVTKNVVRCPDRMDEPVSE
jgi:hypothetical protein